jgi:hypothetical protein
MHERTEYNHAAFEDTAFQTYRKTEHACVCYLHYCTPFAAEVQSEAYAGPVGRKPAGTGSCSDRQALAQEREKHRMSRLFRHRSEVPVTGSRWEPVSLAVPVFRMPIGEGEIAIAVLGALTERSALLLATTGLRVLVNGLPILGGLKVLDHRDEFASEGGRFIYSDESIPEVTTYAAEAGRREIRCSLCRGVLEEGTAVVRCPRCGRLFHQADSSPETPERHCYTYSQFCRHCGHPTALSGALLWSPDQEEHDGGI